MDAHTEASPAMVGLRRPAPPHLVAKNTFRPNLIREVKAAAAAAKGKGRVGDDLESMMERMLRRTKLPTLPKKGLFGMGGSKYSKLRAQYVDENPTCSAIVNRLRCRTVLQVYALLDPLNIGYIDPEGACGCIAAIKKESDELAGLLLHVLEDMLPFISTRGVIEKNVFLRTLREWIEADISGLGPYYSLRLAINPVSTAYREGLPCTNVADRNFYKGTYIPQGLEGTLIELNGGKPSLDGGRKAKYAEPAPNSGQHIRATVGGNLEDHIRDTAMRRERKVSALREQLMQTQMAECTFKPQTTSMPSFGSPFPTRRDIVEQIQVKKDETGKEMLRHNVERKTIPLEFEIATPPEDQPFVFERKDARQKGANEPTSGAAKEKPDKENIENTKEQKEKQDTVEKREKALPVLLQPKTFEFWVFHHGDPAVRPMELHECLRTSPLPPVPLDGLTPEPPKWPRANRSRRREDADTFERDDSSYGTLSGSTPYTLKDTEEMFPHMAQQQKQNRKYHQLHPPLTPGLPTTFKSGFFRERIRESNEERRIRLGQAKSTQPPPGVAEAAAEMRVLKKKLGGSLGGAGDPLLWETSPADFSAGLVRSPKKQPPLFQKGHRRHRPASPF